MEHHIKKLIELQNQGFNYIETHIDYDYYNNASTDIIVSGETEETDDEYRYRCENIIRSRKKYSRDYDAKLEKYKKDLETYEKEMKIYTIKMQRYVKELESHTTP